MAKGGAGSFFLLDFPQKIPRNKGSIPTDRNIFFDRSVSSIILSLFLSPSCFSFAFYPSLHLRSYPYIITSSSTTLPPPSTQHNIPRTQRHGLGLSITKINDHKATHCMDKKIGTWWKENETNRLDKGVKRRDLHTPHFRYSRSINLLGWVGGFYSISPIAFLSYCLPTVGMYAGYAGSFQLKRN